MASDQQPQEQPPQSRGQQQLTPASEVLVREACETCKTANPVARLACGACCGNGVVTRWVPLAEVLALSGSVTACEHARPKVSAPTAVAQ